MNRRSFLARTIGAAVAAALGLAPRRRTPVRYDVAQGPAERMFTTNGWWKHHTGAPATMIVSPAEHADLRLLYEKMRKAEGQIKLEIERRIFS